MDITNGPVRVFIPSIHPDAAWVYFAVLVGIVAAFYLHIYAQSHTLPWSAAIWCMWNDVVTFFKKWRVHVR